MLVLRGAAVRILRSPAGRTKMATSRLMMKCQSYKWLKKLKRIKSDVNVSRKKDRERESKSTPRQEKRQFCKQGGYLTEQSREEKALFGEQKNSGQNQRGEKIEFRK